jgi:CBS domain-containing protein/sporulation protein YlmC with PRC-barrel domain
MIPSEKFRFLFFADLVGKKVVAADGSTLGRLTDLVAFTGEPYPPVESLVVRSGRSRVLVPWTGVEQINGTIRLRPGVDPTPVPGEPVADRVRLGHEVLDRQIVDIEGAKLVRVNDLHFLETKGQLRVAHVDIGLRGLVRRMGWQRPVDLVIGLVRPGARYLRDDAFLSWKLVQPIESAPGRVRIEATKKALASLHPADLAEIIEELDRNQAELLVERLDVETAADALEEASPEVAAQLLEEVPPERAADILEEMAPDESADVLSELPGEAREEILEAMERPEAEEVQELLAYPPHSVGGLMTPDRVQVRPEQTAADAIAEVRRRSDEIPLVYEIFLVDEVGVLKGYFTVKDLLLADPASRAADLARETPVTVAARDRLRDVASAAAKYNLISVPVVDKLGVLRGIVTVDDILSEVVDER